MIERTFVIKFYVFYHETTWVNVFRFPCQDGMSGREHSVPLAINFDQGRLLDIPTNLFPIYVAEESYPLQPLKRNMDGWKEKSMKGIDQAME